MNTSILIQCNMMVLMEHKSTCTLYSSINNSDIVLPQQFMFKMDYGNKVVARCSVCLPST